MGVKRFIALMLKDNVVRDEAIKNKDVVYGSQSIKAQLGFWSREPGDWDVFSKQPLISARRVERRLDKLSGGDHYFIRPALHKGTFKVQEEGPDNKKNTGDDVQVADYTKRPVGLRPIILSNGLRVVGLKDTLRDKMKSVKDPMYAYRREKDNEDLLRIKFFKKIK